MSLIFNDDSASPGAHALVIGVNEYPHLSSGVVADAQVLRGLQQLTSPVPSATHFAQWLLQGYSAPGVAKLGSVRALLSGQQFTAPDGSTIAVGAPTLQNIRTQFREWLARCNEHQDNIAIFYFCGHGFQRDSTYLLPEDVCDDDQNPWANCIDFSTTFAGMRQCRARAQLFFIDACQDIPLETLRIDARSIGIALKTGVMGVAPPRDAPVYMAAAPGKQANGIAGQPSFFTTALVECLSMYGASANAGRNPWWVTTASLREALGERLDRQFRGVQALSFAQKGESTTPLSLRFHSIASPKVLASVSVEPMQAQSEATIRISRNGTTTYERAPSPEQWRDVFNAGIYAVEAKFTSFGDQTLLDEYIAPPVCPLRIVAQP